MEIKNSGIVQEVNGRIITGYLSSFGNIDSDDDIMQKGAFSKSIRERKNDIFFLNQHDWRQPLGKFKVLMEDEKGLYFESEPIANTSYGNDVIELYKNGIVAEHSVGFQTVVSEYDSKTNIRIIKEVKLFEGSAVTLGANSDTPFLGIKSLKDADMLIKALRNGNFTDELALMIEAQIKSITMSLIEEQPTEVTEIPDKPTDAELKQLLTNFKI